MSLQIRRGTTAQRLAIVPALAELVYTTDSKKVYIGDGLTAGGLPIGGSLLVAGTGISYDSTTGIISNSITNTSQLTNDSGFLTSSSLSSYATQTYVNTAISNLVASAPTALDTLNELATALGNDANYSTTISTALGNRLRVDVNTQGLTTQQKTNAATNLGLATVATSGSYTDLTNKPTIPTNTNQLTNGAGFIATSGITGKQDTLVSGTNIKTINGTSILGSGDITISGGGGSASTGNITFSGSAMSAAVVSEVFTSSQWSSSYWQGTMAIRVDTLNVTLASGIQNLIPGSVVTINGTSNYVVDNAQWYGSFGYIYFTTMGGGSITSLQFSTDRIYLQGGLALAGILKVESGKLIGGSSNTAVKLFGDTVAIGINAGLTSQGNYTIAIGNAAAQNGQNSWGIALGYNAGNSSQGSQAIAIGTSAGGSSQGNNAIAIGAHAGLSGQAANSIVLNASNATDINATQAGFVVAPIREDATPTNVLYYNTATKEITYGAGSGGGGAAGGTFTGAVANFNYDPNMAYINLDFSTSTDADNFIANIGSNTVTLEGFSAGGMYGLPSSFAITTAESSWTRGGGNYVTLNFPLISPSLSSLNFGNSVSGMNGTATFSYSGASGSGGPVWYSINSNAGPTDISYTAPTGSNQKIYVAFYAANMDSSWVSAPSSMGGGPMWSYTGMTGSGWYVYYANTQMTSVPVSQAWSLNNSQEVLAVTWTTTDGPSSMSPQIEVSSNGMSSMSQYISMSNTKSAYMLFANDYGLPTNTADFINAPAPSGWTFLSGKVHDMSSSKRAGIWTNATPPSGSNVNWNVANMGMSYYTASITQSS